MKYLLAAILLLPTLAFATGNGGSNGFCNGPGDDCNRVYEDNSIDSDSRAYSDADSRSYSDADARSYSDSDADSRSYSSADGGDAYARGGSARQGQSQGQLNVQGQETDASSRNRNSNDSSVYVEGDSSSYSGEYSSDVLVSGDSINYEVAANKSTLISSGCQVGGAADSIKFGIQVIKQSPACLLLKSSSDALMFAASLNCGDFAGSIVKGGTAPDTSSCLRLRSTLVNQAVGERDLAVELLTDQAKPGLVKKLLHKIW